MQTSTLFVSLLTIGGLTALLGGVLLLVAAFRESILWGLSVLFLPFGNIIYTCVHWREAKTGFLVNLAGIAIAIGAVLTIPDLPKHLADIRSGNTAALFAKQAAPQDEAKDLTAQIQLSRERIEKLNAEFAADGAAMVQKYSELEAQRKALKPDDAAGRAKFDQEAAAYNARNEARKAMRDRMNAEQAQLDSLLAERSKKMRDAIAGEQSRGGVAIGSELARNAKPATAKKVVMYTTATCPACRAAKQYFASKGVSYEEIDVQNSPAGREAFQRLGGRGVPLILVGDKRMEGFNASALDAML